MHPTTPTISGPVPSEGRLDAFTYYEVTVTYQGMPLRYRLHNERDYGIDCQGAMPDCAPRWYGTNMTTEALDLPNVTIQSLRAIWDSLFRPAQLTPTSAPAIVKRIGEYDPTTRQYPAYVAIDGESEQLVGCAWSAGAADRLCDEFAFHFYADNHTPEAAAAIAVEMSEDALPNGWMRMPEGDILDTNGMRVNWSEAPVA